MKALNIKDLSATTELDSEAMADVRGGYRSRSYATPSHGPSFELTKNEFNFTASQGLGQEQNTLVNNGNNAAFVSGITSTVNPHQTGSNNIKLG
jgi:hypothetical protein